RFGYVCGIVVASAFRRTVAGEVFRAGEQAIVRGEVRTLEAADLRPGDGCSEEGVLARTLDDAAPTRITRDIDHRCEGPCDTRGTGLAGGDRLDALDQRRIPRCC